MRKISISAVVLLLLLVGKSTFAQVGTGLNYLTIPPDGKSAALGWTGVASEPDMYANVYNPAKLAWMNYHEYGASVNYTNWQPGLSKGVGMFAFEGYKLVNDQSVVGLDIRYFSEGKINFLDENGYSIYDYTPNELTVGFSYARQINSVLSFGATLRYLRSSPALGVEYQGKEIKALNAFGGDVGLYYNSLISQDDDVYGGLKAGLVVRNLSTVLKYNPSTKGIMAPTSAVAGVGYLLPNDTYNKIFLTAEAGMYLKNGGYTAGAGIQYSFKDIVFLRGGIRYEDPDKSAAQVATGGLGFKFGTVKIDMGYYTQISHKDSEVSPYNNTFTISLGFDLERLQN